MASAPPEDLDWGDVISFNDEGEPVSPEARKLVGLAPLEPPVGKRWVEVFDVELDYMALVDAYLAQHERRHLPKAGAYWDKRVELLERLLGFSLERLAVSPAFEALVATSSQAPGYSNRYWTSPDIPQFIRARLMDSANQPRDILKELQSAALRAIALHALITDPFGCRLEGPHRRWYSRSRVAVSRHSRR